VVVADEVDEPELVLDDSEPEESELDELEEPELEESELDELEESELEESELEEELEGMDVEAIWPNRSTSHGLKKGRRARWATRAFLAANCSGSSSSCSSSWKIQYNITLLTLLKTKK
jgi:hypothetical protein